jgi:uncharacterized protein (DUF169 family)
VALREGQFPELPVAAEEKHCGFVGRARRGEALQVRLQNIGCPLARWHLGADEEIEEIARVLVGWQDADSEAAARRFLDSGPRLEGDRPWVAYYPAGGEGPTPDVVICVGTAAELMELVKRRTRRSGQRLSASTSGIGAACGECTALPLVTGRPNLSLACGGSRPSMELKPGELLLAAPHGTFLFDALLGG